MTHCLRFTHERRWVTVIVMMCVLSESFLITAHSQTDWDLRSGSGNCVAMPACLRDSSFFLKLHDFGTICQGCLRRVKNNEALTAGTVPRGPSLGWLHVPSHLHPRFVRFKYFGICRQTGFIYRQHSFTGIPLDERAFGKWTQGLGGKLGILWEFYFTRASLVCFACISKWNLIVCYFIKFW